MSIDPPPYHPAGAPHYPAPPPPACQPGYGAQPGYGWGPPPAFRPGGYPAPPVHKRPPKTYWYVVGAVLTVVGLIVIGVGIAMVASSIGKEPADDHTFPAGGSTTVHIDAGETKVVYVANADAAGGHHVQCHTSGGDAGAIKMSRYDGNLTLNQWDATFTVTPSQGGDYTIRCTGAASDTFGIGEDPGVGTIVGGVLASVAGGLPLIAGLSTLTVTAWLRRRRSA